ncbi:siderophore biosynthesis protein [Bacteroides sp. 214]|uniref:4'-phosphopantetheinyl transferase family protein n=1 Tax=Bacteroides sp. 214 TaxID=2302935 RepID=UPI0013D283D4|nr:4'-phosphopantetheinyl transferase superfamily protein [Bacteroides sp. 214]NDW13448.1 siderophore biosynthesis protein [Bacteroides sp. 214]
MPIYKSRVEADYKWAIWKLTETLPELLAMFPDGGEMYQSELDTFSSEYRKIEWVTVRLLFYKLLGRLVKIAYYPNGKPYLPDGSAYVSISHTKGYVAVILSPTKKVAVDIERCSERIHKVAPRFLSPEEADFSENSTTCRLLIWSAKESMFKYIGESNVDFKEHLHIEPTPFGDTSFIVFETRTTQNQTFIMYYLLDSDFVMTWML